MSDIREIKCEACPRVCPEDYQKMVEKYSRAARSVTARMTCFGKSRRRTAGSR